MSTSSNVTYPIVRNQPVAQFRYRGSHTKPVRRTVLLTEITRSTFTGYEVRDGNTVRDITDAPIKSFSRDEIKDLARKSLSDESLSW